MIDTNFKVYLIEVNCNPCFELSSTLLARIIPNMIDNALRYEFHLYKNFKELRWTQYFHLQITLNGMEIKKNKFQVIF